MAFEAISTFQYTIKYDLIAVEDLNTQVLLKNHHLAMSIADASWNVFILILMAKAEEAGRQVVKVDPKYIVRSVPLVVK